MKNGVRPLTNFNFERAGIFLGSAFFAYVTYRAFNVGITYDEAWTIRDFVRQHVSDIMTCVPCDANNHFLNTLLIKALFATGIRTEWMARMPNVIAFLFYIYFAYRISILHFTGFMRTCTMLLLLANPFMLDMFGLARGYGLALAFQLASVHHLLLYSADQRMRSALLAMVLAALAPIANLTLMYHMAGVAAILVLLAISRNMKHGLRIAGMVSIVLLVLAGILYIPIKTLLEVDAFYYGGTEGFFQDSLRSFALNSMYDTVPIDTVTIILLLFLGATSITWAIVVIGERRFRTHSMIIGLLTLICIAAVIIQHHLLGSRFVMDRGTLFLHPLLILTFCFAVAALRIQWIRSSLAFIAITCFGANLLANANLHKTLLWDFESPVKEILVNIDRLAQDSDRQIEISFSWPYKSVAYHYLEYPEFSNIRVREGGGEIYIFLGRTLRTAPYDLLYQPFDPTYWDTLWSYPDVDTYVLGKPGWFERIDGTIRSVQ